MTLDSSKDIVNCMDSTATKPYYEPVPTDNFTLVTYSGCGSENDPSYILTAHFSSREAEEQGWAGPIMEDIITFLRREGVTHVYDGELSYEEDGADEDGFFTLDRWAEIMISYK